jgi:hypothetical protein
LEVQLKRPKSWVIALGLPLKAFSLQPIYLSSYEAQKKRPHPFSFELPQLPWREALFFNSLSIAGRMIHR